MTKTPPSFDSASSAHPWAVTGDRGFLMASDPLAAVPSELFGEDMRQAEAGAAALSLAETLSDHVASGDLRQAVQALPVLSIAQTCLGDAQHLVAAERLHQAYAFLANAYLWLPGAEPLSRLPSTLALPYVALSEIVGRPPVLSYTGSQLCNFRRIDPTGPLTVENLNAIQVFQDLPDEEWFWIIHIAIEAAGAPAVMASKAAAKAALAGDQSALEAALIVIAEGLETITALAQRIDEGCGPDVFFRTLRPFLFSPPEGVIFEGVAAYGEEPKAFLGQTGAQSALLPAICGGLGIRHGETELTDYLDAVRAYMPEPHRRFLAELKDSTVRDFCAAGPVELIELYNLCVDRAVGFRRFHLTLAARYIAANVPDPKGTGGTDFMRWLKHMTRETEDQRLT